MDFKKKGLGDYVSNPVADKPVKDMTGMTGNSKKADLDRVIRRVAESVKSMEESSLANKENAERMYDLATEICNAYLNEDGTPRDFADREGRNALMDSIKANTRELEKVKKNFTAFKDELLSRIPDHVEARLCDEHAALLDRFYKHRVYYILTLVLLTVSAACLGIGWMMKSNEYTNKAKEYERLIQRADRWEKANKDAIDFGTYMRKNNPNTFRRWKKRQKDND